MTAPTEHPVSVEQVLAALWRREQARAAGSGTGKATSGAHGENGTRMGARPVNAPGGDASTVQDLCRQFGERAMDTVSATIRADHAALVRNSAALFETLFAIWGEVGLDPREVWIELHKREQLGSLLMQLNQVQNQLPRRVLKPWRVDSTKLP